MTKQELIALATKFVKKANDLGWTDVSVAHSNTLIAALFNKQANTMPTGQTKTRLKALAAYILLHPEQCYGEIKAWADAQWYPDYALLQAVLDSVKLAPVVKKFIIQNSQSNHDITKLNL